MKNFICCVCPLCFGLFVHLIAIFFFNLFWEQCFLAQCLWVFRKNKDNCPLFLGFNWFYDFVLTCLCDCTLLSPDMFVVFCAHPYLALSKTFSCDPFPPFVTDLLLSLQLTILPRGLSTAWVLFWFVARFLSLFLSPFFYFFLCGFIGTCAY